MEAQQQKVFTWEEVEKHSTLEDLWVVISNEVYDLSNFPHPGGDSVLLEKDVAGKDVTELFFQLHRGEVLERYKRLRLGRVTSGSSPEYLISEPGSLSRVPHGEPLILLSQNNREFSPSALFAPSPYLSNSHLALQRRVRWFFDQHVKPIARSHELTGERPTDELFKLMGNPEWELNAMRMGPGKHLYGRNLPGGVKPEEFNYFHELVVIQELVRIGSPGFMAGLQAGMVIGLPPLLNFGTPEMQEKIIPPILRGEKFICLAISEAMAGSDVRGMTTWARKTPDGKKYIINGSKKWITNGMWSDWFMTGCRTSENALSMILIPRTEGVETRPIKTSYSSAAGTAYVTFDNVEVPVEYCLGGHDGGSKVIMSNFNHERWVICCRIARYSRFIVEECFKFAYLRQAFGKKLIDQPVIRQKLSTMISKVEAGQSWLESITYQMTHMSYSQQSSLLAGPMAGLKYFLSRAGGEISDDSVQIFGGRGLTQTGMGAYIEQFQRTYKFDSILGGSEEVLADLYVRQANKKMPRAVL